MGNRLSCLFALLLPLLLADTPPLRAARRAAAPEPSGLDARVEAFFRRPFRGFQRGRVPKSHRIITLSNLSEYCAHAHGRRLIHPADAERCADELLYLALHERIRPYDEPVAQASLGGHGLYLSHLNIVLGNHRRLTDKQQNARLHRKVSRHLARLSLAQDHAHAPSFPGVAVRWPADQTATLYSLHLYRAATGEDLVSEPTAKFLSYLRTNGTSDWGALPVSEISGKTKSSKLPRGCALSFSVRYLAYFSGDEARSLWRRYKREMLFDAGFAAGFREWPPGVSRAGDIDSGPIVFGLGAAATGLGLGAARAMGDATTYAQLKATEGIVRSVGGDGLNAVGDSILSVSIALSAEVMRPAPADSTVEQGSTRQESESDAVLRRRHRQSTPPTVRAGRL